MASRINIYSQLLISTIRIADISNSNCRYRQFELRISTIRIVDISDSNCGYQHYCWYLQFELRISV